MKCYLIRHAKAGERSSWDGDDQLRPLSRRGQNQAAGLLELFDNDAIERVFSSRYVRSLETVVPIASVRGLAIEPAAALAEGAALDDVLALIRKHAHRNTVMCTHGDIIPMVLDHYASKGVDLGERPEWPKASTWELDLDEMGELVSATYWPPPPD